MKLWILLLPVLNILPALSQCPQLSGSGTCDDMVSNLLIDGKICVEECPSQFIKVCDSIQLNTCTECMIPTSPTLFELEFWKIQDLSATYIASSINSSDKWSNPSEIPYNLDTKSSPFPTRSRGFYFSSTSSIISNQHYIPSLYFTASAWILPILTGEILAASLNSRNYIKLIYNLELFTFHIWTQSPNGGNDVQINISSDIIDNKWQYLSIQINQIECDAVNLTVSRNNAEKWTSEWNSAKASFPSGDYQWTIGMLESNSFTGFLYWLKAANSLDSMYWVLDTANMCNVLNYFGDCMKCDDESGCQNVLCIAGEDDCSRCYSKDCSECYGYSENMCTECKIGVLPYCCDWLANNCSSAFLSTECIDEEVLINGVCLYAIPYGFVNNLPVDTPVINADFTQSFEGVYDSILVTGESSDTYNYWNSPESVDPLPAKQRGLYFIPDSYLKATINLFHTFTIGAWVYPITGNYVTYTGNLLKINSSGTIKIIMQDLIGNSIAYSASTTPDLESWNFISYSIEYHDNGTSSITPYINASPDVPLTSQDGLFRPMAGGSLFLGSADFNGFISLFLLWQVAISNFVDFRSYFDDEGGNLSLWSCDFDSYFTGSYCKKCLNSCQSGCKEADSCNICDNEFCLQCSSFEPNSCTLCEENRSGSLCECNSGYFQPTGQVLCSPCYSGCSSCTGSLYYQCMSCELNYYYFSPAGACLSDCPLGYTKSANECLFNSELIFDLNLNSLSGVVYDRASLIPVITGSSEQFYPNYEEDDPKSADLRGFYFNGKSSIMRLPEYKTYISPKLKIGPIFTISIWLNIENESSVILSKSDISNNYSIVYAISLINSKPALALLLSSGSIFLYSSSTSLNTFEWSHLAFLVNIDVNTGNTTVTYYLNTNPDSLLTAGLGYFQDINLNVATIIGARQLSQSIEGYFQGFLYEMQIFNSVYDIGLLSKTSCNENCRVCNMTHLCMPNCNITETWVGPDYNKCQYNSSCKNTYEENTNSCSTCKDALCDICIHDSTNECKKCKENASFKENSCICDLGFNGTASCTYVPFYVDLLVFSDNSLSLDFSDPLYNNLTLDDFIVLIENNLEITWSLENINDTYYKIPTKINEKIEKNTIINITFFDLSHIKSIYNGILNSSTISSRLNEYDPNPLNAVASTIASKVTTTVQSTVIGTVALSFANPNPSSLWGLLNCLQILSYLSLSGIPFSKKMSDFLSNLNSYNILPNFFEYLIDEKQGNKAYDEAINFGYNTDLILLNQDEDFFIVVASILCIPFVIYIAGCSYRLVGKRFLNILKNYKYGFYIRFWIQSYLELGSAAFVGLKMFNVNNWAQIVNIIICLGIALLFIISPIAFLWFSYRHRAKIQSKSKDFISRYDSFFYEFETEKGLVYSLYYFVYFVRRFIYAANLVFLSESPRTQVSINIICSLLSIIYMFIYWPFEDKIIQVSNLTSEIMIGVIVFLTSFYLFDVSSNVISYAENAIIFISMIIIGTQLCASIAIFARAIYQILRYKLSLYGNAKLSIHPMEEVQETMQTD